MNWFACFGMHIGTYCMRRLVISMWCLKFFLGMKYHTEEEVSTQFCTFIILGIVCSREVRVLWILVLIYGNGACYYQYCYELR
jgi:hypothetical protein